MTAANEYPVLDGICPSHADISVICTRTGLPLIDMSDIKSINTRTSLEVGEQREGGRLIRRTTGNAKDEASWTLYRSGYQKLIRGLKAAAPLRRGQRLISLVHFQIKVAHTPPGDVEIYEMLIRGCRLMGRDMASAEGTDAQTVDVKLSPMQVIDIIDGEEVVLI